MERGSDSEAGYLDSHIFGFDILSIRDGCVRGFLWISYEV